MTIERMGASPRRREDVRFVTGQGAYLDDLKFDRLTHAVVLRSPHAHALIRSIDAAVARRAPGVIAVLTAAEAATDGLKPLRPYAEANVQTGEPFAFAPQPLLAQEKVRFGGEPVAMIVAETHAQALDAGLAIVVKRRKSATEIEAVTVIGEVEGKNVIIVDDLTETAGTLVGAAKILRSQGARNIYAGVSHTVLTDLAVERLKGSEIKELITTDSVPARADSAARVKVLSVAELLGEGIRRIHDDESVSSLFDISNTKTT